MSLCDNLPLTDRESNAQLFLLYSRDTDQSDGFLQMTGANNMDEADASGCVNVIHGSTGTPNNPRILVSKDVCHHPEHPPADPSCLCCCRASIHHLISSNNKGEYAVTGATALMAAAGKGRLADVAALLTAGADPLLRSRDGSSAQDWATKFGHAETAEFLGSQMEVPCSSSCSPHQECGPRICHCGRSVMDIAVGIWCCVPSRGQDFLSSA